MKTQTTDETTTMTAGFVGELIRESIVGDDDRLADLLKATRSFEESGVLTNNAGFTLKMLDGTEFQITIVRSR